MWVLSATLWGVCNLDGSWLGERRKRLLLELLGEKGKESVIGVWGADLAETLRELGFTNGLFGLDIDGFGTVLDATISAAGANWRETTGALFAASDVVEE